MTETKPDERTYDPPVTRAEIVAAKLLVDLDKRLGEETPEIFKEIAKLSRD